MSMNSADDGYAPETDTVRAAYQRRLTDRPREQRGREFDRWLAGVKADAWTQGFDVAALFGNRSQSPHAENPYRRDAGRPYRKEQT